MVSIGATVRLPFSRLYEERCWCASSSPVGVLIITQTHQSQCLVQDERFRGVDCDIFTASKPPTMALSTLVVIEMLNALNR